jgi:hypothetical protein
LRAVAERNGEGGALASFLSAVALLLLRKLQLSTSDCDHAHCPLSVIAFCLSLNFVGCFYESGNNSTLSFDTYAGWGFANVASQSKLGVLSKRWFGHRRIDFTRSHTFGEDLSNTSRNVNGTRKKCWGISRARNLELLASSQGAVTEKHIQTLHKGRSIDFL